jgi:hypothetical protein
MRLSILLLAPLGAVLRVQTCTALEELRLAARATGETRALLRVQILQTRFLRTTRRLGLGTDSRQRFGYGASSAKADG